MTRFYFLEYKMKWCKGYYFTREHTNQQAPQQHESDSTYGHHQMKINTRNQMIMFFGLEDGKLVRLNEN